MESDEDIRLARKTMLERDVSTPKLYSSKVRNGGATYVSGVMVPKLQS